MLLFLIIRKAANTNAKGKTIKAVRLCERIIPANPRAATKEKLNLFVRYILYNP
jgi:hypothetical protein